MSERVILIQGAVNYEIDFYLSKIRYLKKIEINGYNFYEGKIGELPIVISETKVGMTNATIATSIGIYNYNPIFILNQGIAGAHDVSLKIGDIVIGQDSININSHVSKFRAKNTGSDSLEWDFSKRVQKYSADKRLVDIFSKSIDTDYIGVLGSGDMFNKEIDRIQLISRKLNTLCEDMESAAVYQCCSTFNISCIGIRIISNNLLINNLYERGIATNLQRLLTNILIENNDDLKTSIMEICMRQS